MSRLPPGRMPGWACWGGRLDELTGTPGVIEIGCDRVAVIAADSPTLVPAQVLGHLAMDAGQILSRVRT